MKVASDNRIFFFQKVSPFERDLENTESKKYKS